MHERECKGYISFNRGVNELNRGVNELNRGVNELNRGVNHSVARQGCNLLRAAVTSAVTSQGCCCGNLQIHPLDLGHDILQADLTRLIVTNIRVECSWCTLDAELFNKSHEKSDWLSPQHLNILQSYYFAPWVST